MIKMGNVNINGICALAPMAGVTDLPFRLLCKEQGAGYVVTEMVSAKAITYGNKNTRELMKIEDVEHPIALQLFGSEPDIMAEAARMIEDVPADIIDINMGCPVPKVVNNNEGSGLMKSPELAGEIVRKVVQATKKPVTVKFRKGFYLQDDTAVEFAKIMEHNGAKALAVHGRTREQYYHGQADWDVIRRVKEAVNVPVWGNGDVFTPEDAKRMMTETGCDGIMVARGAKGNPWIFHRINMYCEKGILLPEPTLEEKINMIKRHARLQVDIKGEYTGIREMRKHVAWYTQGCKNSAKLRAKVNQIDEISSLIELLENTV